MEMMISSEPTGYTERERRTRCDMEKLRLLARQQNNGQSW
jgi:hypothetical protein